MSDFLLVFHVIYISILHYFKDITFQKVKEFKSHDPEHIPFGFNLRIMILLVLFNVSVHTKCA